MPYSYKEQREAIFTEKGQVLFLKMRDAVKKHLEMSGAVMAGNAMVTGDVWEMLACLDRMVELGEIREVTGPDVMGQHRVFVDARR
jgi:hypothetical protein